MEEEKNNKYSILKFNLLTSLLSILNENNEYDTDFIIAKYILNNLNIINKTSIYKIAKDCYTSRSSVQRFIKNIGYDSFTQMKSNLQEVIIHEGALLDYTDRIEYIEYISDSIKDMTKDIADSTKSNRFKSLLNHFIKAKSVTFLVAEDSVHACKLLQQQLLAIGKLVRIVTSASKNIDLLSTLNKNDLLIVCSVTGNFALAINEQLKHIKATKCLITANRTTLFNDNYAFIYYISDNFKPSSHDIKMIKNIYTTYGLTFLFDIFYHEYYLYHNS